jgi:Holliday junction resolvasome RuvABC endonuclease subunit
MPVTGKIMTFDLASRTGYAAGLAGEVPTFSHHQFPSTGDNFGRHQANAREWLHRIISIEKPELVGYEQPSLFGNTTPATVIKLCSYASTIEEVCLKEHLGVRIKMVNPSQLKKFWTGKGNAKKPEMVARAKAFGFAVAVDDEADALAMWFFMVDCYGSDEHKRRFEQMRYEVDMGRQQKAVF